MKLATLNGGDQIVRMVTDGGFRGRWALLTMTYAPGVVWQPRHITELCKHIRQWLARRGHEARYEWVAELQLKRMARTGESAREVVHYHLIVWVPRDLELPFPDQCGWWPHGLTRTEEAIKPVGYLAKYMSKGDGTPFPKGLRLHGRGGLDAFGRRVVSWWLLPRYVREFAAITYERIRRAPGGGWFSRDTGQWWPSWGAQLQSSAPAL